MRAASTLPACLLACLLAAAPAFGQQADALSDAPEAPAVLRHPVKDAASYAEALQRWSGVEDVNAWIGARFRYDMARAMQLSETQRAGQGRVAIHAPEAFFADPAGICVDLARFGVETLRAIAPESKPRYVMIEFDPAVIAGNTLRRHWVVGFERDGQHWFFADSKRPGHVAGPYAGTGAFVADYARYRGRPVVGWRDADSYQRRQRTSAVRQQRDPLP